MPDDASPPPTAAGLLPDPVARFVARSAPQGPVPRQVRITQRGEMWKRPGARAMPFTASQSFAVERIAFCWRARFPIAGPLAMGVVDEFSGDEGRLVVSLLGFPLSRQRGPEVSTGEALRYLAELPLLPSAMVHNAELEWRALDDRAAEVAATVRGERLAVRFDFDAAGDIRRASTPGRAMRRDDSWVRTPWAGEFRDYETLGGLRVPTRAEASWDLPEGRFVYWTGMMLSARTREEPFGSDGPTGRTAA